jgi:hypothetical protein
LRSVTRSGVRRCGPAPITAVASASINALKHRLRRIPGDLIRAGGLQRIQQLKQGRLVQGHRVHSFATALSGLAKTHTMAP